MYNQVSRGPNFGPGGSHPPPPAPPAQHAYQQQAHPPPPPQFQQVHHAYLHGPPNASSTGTASLSFQAPHGVASSGKYGNTVVQQNFTSHGQNLQHSSNSGGVQSLHAHLSVPPPPIGHSQQEMSWPPGPPSRILPPPPPPPTSSQGQVLYKPPFLPPPPQAGGSQNVQHSHNTLPPPPPLPGSGFLANAPDGGYLHSNAGNYQVPAVTASLQPPMPPCPAPISPSPPPPAPPVTSAFSNVAHCHPKSSKVSGSELKALDLVDKSGDFYSSGIAPVKNSDPDQNSGSLREVASADRDEQLLSTRDENKNEPQLRPQAMDSTDPWYQLHVTTESADSDMEMEG